jgi:hypothetical protein
MYSQYQNVKSLCFLLRQFFVITQSISTTMKVSLGAVVALVGSASAFQPTFVGRVTNV